MDENSKKMLEGLSGLQATLGRVVNENPEAIALLSEDQKKAVNFAKSDIDFSGNDLQGILDKCQELTKKMK